VDLDGKTVLLTGATGGIGRAIAEALAGRGASLVLSARKVDALNELAGSLPGEHRVATADLGEGPHMGYAVQWFAFAIILVVGYIAFIYSQTKRGVGRP